MAAGTLRRTLPALSQCQQVWSLEDLSSRVHMHTGQTRCWERSVLCNLPGIYYASPTHSRWNLWPKVTGREVRVGRVVRQGGRLFQGSGGV